MSAGCWRSTSGSANSKCSKPSLSPSCCTPSTTQARSHSMPCRREASSGRWARCWAAFRRSGRGSGLKNSKSTPRRRRRNRRGESPARPGNAASKGRRMSSSNSTMWRALAQHVAVRARWRAPSPRGRRSSAASRSRAPGCVRAPAGRRGPAIPKPTACSTSRPSASSDAAHFAGQERDAVVADVLVDPGCGGNLDGLAAAVPVLPPGAIASRMCNAGRACRGGNEFDPMRLEALARETASDVVHESASPWTADATVQQKADHCHHHPSQPPGRVAKIQSGLHGRQQKIIGVGNRAARGVARGVSETAGEPRRNPIEGPHFVARAGGAGEAAAAPAPEQCELVVRAQRGGSHSRCRMRGATPAR